MPTADPLFEDMRWIRRNMELGDLFRVVRPLDDQALGHWATVWDAYFRQPAGANASERWDPVRVALKIMRRTHLPTPRVYEVFSMEAGLLRDWHGRGSAAQLLACGYLRDAAPEAARLAPENLLLCADVDAFGDQAATRQAHGWRPFLVLSLVPFGRTLLYRLRQLQHPNTHIPLSEALEITIQGLDLLQTLHDAHLFYRDHKPEHIIWHGGRVQFLDWNGALALAAPPRGSHPEGEAQADIQNFIAYGVFPLFAARTYDNQPVSAIRRGAAHPPLITVPDHGVMDFYAAAAWLPLPLQRILSRPFYPLTRRYSQARDLAQALRAYRDAWAVPHLAGRLDRAVVEVAQAQQHLRAAQQQMNLLVRLAEQRPNRDHAIVSEITRFHQGLQHMINHHLLPLEEDDPPS
jgi:hypothetical protein